jgi:hypothetical protein
MSHYFYHKEIKTEEKEVILNTLKKEELKKN